MAGILDKIKGMFSKGNQAEMKAKAGEVKDKVDDIVHKAGDKVPDKVKETFEKVSDKVEGIIPGHKDGEGADTEGADTEGADTEGADEADEADAG